MKGLLNSIAIEYRVWLGIIAVAGVVFLAMGDYFLWWVSAGCFAVIVSRCWLVYRRGSRPPGRWRWP